MILTLVQRHLMNVSMIRSSNSAIIALKIRCRKPKIIVGYLFTHKNVLGLHSYNYLLRDTAKVLKNKSSVI